MKLIIDIVIAVVLAGVILAFLPYVMWIVAGFVGIIYIGVAKLVVYVKDLFNNRGV